MHEGRCFSAGLHTVRDIWYIAVSRYRLRACVTLLSCFFNDVTTRRVQDTHSYLTRSLFYFYFFIYSLNMCSELNLKWYMRLWLADLKDNNDDLSGNTMAIIRFLSLSGCDSCACVYVCALCLCMFQFSLVSGASRRDCSLLHLHPFQRWEPVSHGGGTFHRPRGGACRTGGRTDCLSLWSF